MSFGFGVGDFIAVGELAWKLYTNCYKAAKGAPAEYQALLEDLKTSSSLIRMLDEEMKNKASVLGSASSDRVHLMVDTVFQVQVVLQAIQKLAEKYEILSGQSALKRSWKPRFIWERIKWSVELKDVDSLRNKLGQHNTALNLLLTCAGHSSLERLEITSKGIVKDVTEIREYIKKLAYKSQVPSITLPNAVNEDDDMFMVTISATLMRSAERLQPWNTIGVDEWIRNGRWWLLKAQASLEGNLSKGAPIPVQAYADLLKASWILTDIMSSHPQRPFLSSRSNYELQLLNIVCLTP
ncbi:hypothetical protein F5Y04DRAFT_117987 [Hypomontagnella monticulosa]|nr:hypothetical protein F5Y04DRAFT_117987 [Hypomontagnella monticulosa]